MKFTLGLLMGLIFTGTNLSATEPNQQGFDASAFSTTLTDGEARVADLQPDKAESEVLRVQNRRIQRVLERERSVSSVSDAMIIKRSGLRYVNNLRDFRDLSSIPFDSPSNAYLDARANFVNDHIGPFLRRGMDTSLILQMERRVRRVNDVIRLKNQVIPFMRNLREYNEALGLRFNSPSDSMLAARDRLVSQTVDLVPVNRNFDLQDLVYLNSELEKKSKSIGTALKVRNKLYQHVKNLRQFYRVSEIQLRSPTDAYVRQNAEQIANEVGNYINRRSRIRLIIKIEKLTKTVGQAIRVKEAGLKAVSSPDQFWNLTDYSVANPSEAYKRAVSQFIHTYGDTYGK